MNDFPDRPDAQWRPPPNDLRVGANEVHVWRAGLQRKAAELERLEALLAADERRRAERFHFPHLRDRFVAARGILRELLGRFLARPPAEIRFEENSHGKPSLAAGCPQGLRFNVSHSGDAALFALALGREVGVDVEQIRPLPAGERIAERFFTPGESARLRSLPAERRDEAFFECWVRKEAFVKAVGQGVSFGLNRFELPAVAGTSPEPIPFTSPTDAAVWSLAPLRPGRGYTGAVVAAGTDWIPALWHWQPQET